ncbi:MAG: helix-hairpin-helix domain-containing protein [Oscillospiraceae bacterium]|nr:helix-hairpin-helix domain-containing protein [Oscillospiraceae bacterium]
MKIRIKRAELIIAALTAAFALFIGGYFTGRGSVANVVKYMPAEESHAEASTQPAAMHDTDQEPGSTEAAPEVAVAGASTSNGHSEPADSGEEEPAEADDLQPGAPRADGGKININTATKAELMDLPRIGPVISERIVTYRNANGPFERIEDIMKVTGIGQKTFDGFKDLITVG